MVAESVVPSSPPAEPLRVLVLGAGVVGQVYAGRLAAAGCRVWLAARGSRLDQLSRDAVRLLNDGTWVHHDVALVDAESPLPEADVLVVAVRADQVDAALEVARPAGAPTVVTLGHVTDPAALREQLGDERVVLAYPGIGGGLASGGVAYRQLPFLSTTIGSCGGREVAFVAALRRAGFDVDVAPDIDGWLATQAVFRSILGAAILHEGSSTALDKDPQRVKQVITAMRDAFRALETHGITPSPASLRAMFGQVPLLISVPALRRELRGETGSVALDPHFLATRDNELPLLVELTRKVTGNPARVSAILAAAGYAG